MPYASQGPRTDNSLGCGSGTEIKTSPGLTAFYDCQTLYELITPEEKAIADNSNVVYASHPYVYIFHLTIATLYVPCIKAND
jgi:hypothetical protein